jgi:dTDP-glucose 4,6-dehydratase
MTTPPEDLQHIREYAPWDRLRGMRLFLTGGTGFFGRWLLDSLADANDRLDLGATAVVLSRDPERLLQRAPHLTGRGDVEFHRGDIRNFAFPAGTFTHVIHAATETSTRLQVEQPLVMLDTIIAGTRRALDFAVASGAGRFLLTSSGAVYGRQPPELANIPETYGGAPDPADPRSTYGEGKRVAELLCSEYARQHGVGATIARCFAFVGPHLPLDAHFAVGNFLRDAAGGGPVRVSGDGTPYRSYLHAADLAIWLWTILACGVPGRPYNVGSDQAVSIAELANAVAACFDPRPTVEIARQADATQPPERYVPAIDRARVELGLSVRIPLGEALRRTIRTSDPNKVIP